LYGLRDAVALITDIAGGKFEGYIDVYTGAYTGVPTITLSVEEINKLLGSAMDGDMVEDTLQRLDFSYTRTGAIFAVTPPFERLDVRIKEDVIEEVGRIYGYEHIAPVSLPRANWSPAIHKMFYYKHRIGKLLQQQGFSEVYTYAFMNKGDIMLQNPLASDKNFLRGNLADGLEQSMQTNTHNKDLLGLYDIRIFETGKVFAPQETTRLGLAVAGTNAEIILRRAIQLLQEDLNGNEIQPLVTKAPAENYALVEIDLDALTSVLPEPTAYEASEPLREVVKYKKISPYPFVLRDIAVWVPKIVHAEDVFMAIKKEAGDLFTMGTHFDTFLKGDKASYAFRLVFQSPKKTLTDEEVNSIMDQITKSLHDHAGWEVR
jgi:phenylalanyl-tRNA synthetase beta chain